MTALAQSCLSLCAEVVLLFLAVKIEDVNKYLLFRVAMLASIESDGRALCAVPGP